MKQKSLYNRFHFYQKKGEDKPNTYYKSCHFVEEEFLSLQ